MINNLRLAKDLHGLYQNSYPFSFVMLDNFVDEMLLHRVREEYLNYDNWSSEGHQHEVLKYFSPAGPEDILTFNYKCPFTRYLYDYLCSPEALLYLEELTGIKELIPDYSFLGAGMHRIESGGKLSVHADFNMHRETGNYRRINLLLYLNTDWQEEWGGDLELWDKDLTQAYVKVSPIFNRVVIFNTTDNSFHGHPKPLNTPAGISRLSLALYYYTKDRPEEEKSPWHSVLWKDTE